ncbi:hypothetical protein RJ641_001246, partial [Dillenia turbinata]
FELTSHTPKRILAIAVLGFGVWTSTHHDECRRSLTLPVLGLDFYSLCFCFSCRFIVTNNGSGHSLSTKNWKRMKSCPVKADDCNNLPKKYEAKISFAHTTLILIYFFCEYLGVNASYYDVTFHPVSSYSYHKLYNNSPASNATIVFLASKQCSLLELQNTGKLNEMVDDTDHLDPHQKLLASILIKGKSRKDHLQATKASIAGVLAPFSVIFAVTVVSFGIWMSTPHDGHRRSLTL